MAAPRKPTAPPADPVNSEQLENLEQRDPEPETGAAAPAAQAQGPSAGELEERAAEAEERAEAAERRADSLEGEVAELRAAVEQLLRAKAPASTDARPQQARRPEFELADEDRPVFDPERPHGLVVGDTEILYEQDGHQFGHDQAYVRSLPMKLRGTGRPFNPRLVGVVKPRPGALRVDGLDGIRGRE